MSKTVIGVMGAGELATAEDCQLAYDLGKAIAERDWVLLTGGRNVGVMDAASRGAKAVSGLVVGVLPHNSQDVSEAVDIAIVTDLGNGRNNVNVLSSDVVIACGMGLGTVSEIALALKNHQPVILLQQAELTHQFFASFNSELLYFADSVGRAIAITQDLID